MEKSSKSAILRGFENGEFKRAVLSFLKEKCPADLPENGEIPVSFGLQVIRRFIECRKSSPDAAPATA